MTLPNQQASEGPLSPGPPLAGALLLETSIPRPLHSLPLDPFPRLLNAEPARLQTGCKALQRGKRFSEKSEASPSSKAWSICRQISAFTTFVLVLCSLRWRTWSPVLSCWSFCFILFSCFFIYSSSAIDEVSHGVMIWIFASLLSATDRSSACLFLLLPCLACLCLALPALLFDHVSLGLSVCLLRRTRTTARSRKGTDKDKITVAAILSPQVNSPTQTLPPLLLLLLLSNHYHHLPRTNPHIFCPSRTTAPLAPLGCHPPVLRCSQLAVTVAIPL